jgi:hypothetical protein
VPYPPAIDVNPVQPRLAAPTETARERSARETRDSRLLALRSQVERYRRHGLGDDPEVARLEAELRALLEQQP